MRILAIGDAHGDLKSIRKIPLKNADLILLTGDFGKADLARRMHFDNVERKSKGLPEIEYSPNQRKRAFMEIYNSSLAVIKYLAKNAPVYVIFGNVEMSDAEVRKESREIGIKLPLMANALKKIKNVKIINNKLINFKGIRIGGLKYFIDVSWVKEFKPGNYSEKLKSAGKESRKAKGILGRFGKIDILLCHQPPYGILDKVAFKGAPKNWLGKHAGSKVIFDYVKKKQPKHVFCGHIHEHQGCKRLGKSEICNLGVAGHKFADF